MKLAAALLTLFIAASAQAADVTGKWKSSVPTPDGQTMALTFTFKVDGAKLTGTASFERMGAKGQATLAEGKVEGAKVSFVETFEMQGTTVRIEYTGLLAGDEIKFTRKVGDFASEEFVAKRAKE